MPYAIIISGTQGTGKSTLYGEMKRLYHPLFVNTDGIVQFVAECNNEELTNENYWNLRNTTLAKLLQDTIPKAAGINYKNVCWETTNASLSWILQLSHEYDQVYVYFVTVNQFETVWSRINNRNQSQTNTKNKVKQLFDEGKQHASFIQNIFEFMHQQGQYLNVHIETKDNSFPSTRAATAHQMSKRELFQLRLV